MDKKSKLIYGIIIALAFGLLAFAVITSLYKNKGQKIDDGEAMVSSSAESIETIYFNKELLEWRDEYGPCLTCTPENGFSKDGFVLMEPEKSARLCYGKKEKTGLGFNYKEDEGLYNYYFLELIRKENLIRGNVESYPYGTDSSRATFEGVYDEGVFEALVLGEFSAEGDTWQEEQTLRFAEVGVQSLFSQIKEDENGVYRVIPGFEKNLGFTFPEISCDEFDQLQQESGYADVMDSISDNNKKTFSGKIIDIENGKDGYTVVLQDVNDKKIKTTLSIPNLGIDSDFDFSDIKIGNIISVSGESFTLGDDFYITASAAKLVKAKKNEAQIKKDLDENKKPTTKDVIPSSKGKELLFTVGSEKIGCTGAFPQECYVVNGELFYDEIQGFDFESGYEYILRVDERVLCDFDNMHACPLDIGAYSYHVTEVLEKTKK